MPRILHVSFTKEFDVTIVADNLSELRAALQKQKREFDDWCENSEWQFQIMDPLAVKNPDMIPRTFGKPDMGVMSGKCFAIEDYQEARPNYLDAVDSEALDVARRLTLEKFNLKLPFPEVANAG